MCRNLPISGQLVRPTSCWITGPTSVVVAGTDPSAPSDGAVFIINSQQKLRASLPGSGPLRIKGVAGGHACLAKADGTLADVEVSTGRTAASCSSSAATPSTTSGTPQTSVPSSASAASLAPPSTTSIYVYGTWVETCGPTATTGCPIYVAGANATAPPAPGGLAVLDNGAPCFNPNSGVYGTELFNTRSCADGQLLAMLAKAWVRGYESTHGAGTPPMILAIGTSSSLNGVNLNYSLTVDQMRAHGAAWFNSVVKPVSDAAAGALAPITAWGASDIEEDSTGNWYGAAEPRAWVAGFGAAAGLSAGAPACSASTAHSFANYGDEVVDYNYNPAGNTAYGWTSADLYYVSWGAPGACAVPEIYVSYNATEWENLNRWALANGFSAIQFDGPMCLSAGGLSGGASWSALSTATSQTPPYLTCIGALSSQPAVAPEAPNEVVAVAGAASATVSWSQPTWDGAAHIRSYTVTPYAGTTALTATVVNGVAPDGWPTPITTTINGLANGTAFTFGVAATNSAGTGPQSARSAPVIPSDAYPYTAVSWQQYSLTNSDGVHWQDIDATNLGVTITPAINTRAVLRGNADLWTATAGYNQDLGIAVNGQVIAWKESGGYGGTFSPNAAAVQADMSMTAGATYTVRLQWKTNRASGATIYAGAGAGARFSPTRLTVSLGADETSVLSTKQYVLTNNDGAHWQDVDGSTLALSAYTAPAAGTLLITGNADLWTAVAGYNQDLAIAVNGTVIAWKESGGFAGTYSPNAALVQTTYPVVAGQSYGIKLQWKANKAQAPGAAVYSGAGASAPFSPTTLQVRLLRTGVYERTIASQYSLSNSDGTTWQPVDAANLRLSLTPTTNCVAVLSANADLWTASAGYNQDMGVAVTPSDGISFPSNVIAWKESGGFNGTYSPNAAFVETVVPLNGGQTYAVTLEWKTNRAAAGTTIYAGAGPSGGPFSPTRLTAELVCS
jgi:hypothetical protein